LDGALTAIFEDLGLPEDTSIDASRKPAATLIKKMERDLVANVYRWTGHFPERTRPLVRYLAQKAEELKQVYPADRENAAATAITTLVTALAMNHVHRGTYLP
jgi:G3E family GTPase